jgi:HK97 family phage prohead protease
VTVVEHLTRPAAKGITMVDGDTSGEIAGYCATYGTVDLQDDVLEPGAVTKSIEYWSRQSAKLPLLDWHGNSLGALIGSVQELKSTPVGLWFRASFSNDAAAQAARRKCVEGVLSGVSIGYLPIKQSYKQLGDRTVRVLHEIRLMEISLTPMPANPEAQVVDIKSHGGGYGGYSSPADDDLAGLEMELVELGAMAERQASARLTPSLDAEGHRTMAGILDKVEGDSQLVELEAWAANAITSPMYQRDPNAVVAERDRRRRSQANGYSAELAAWRDRNQ